MSSKSPFYHHVWMPWSEYVISTCFLNSHLRLPVLKCNGIITIRCFCAGIPQAVCLLGHFILSGMTRDSYANEAEHRPRTAYGIVLAEPIWPTGFHCEIPNFYIMQSQTVWEKGHADINTSLGTWCCAAWKKKKWLCSNMTLEKKNSSLRGCVIVPPCSSWRIISGWQRCSARGWLMWIWCPYGKRPVVLFYTPLFSNGIGLHKTMAHCWHSSRLLIGLTFAEFRGYSFE